jgi:hypothetical protein
VCICVGGSPCPSCALSVFPSALCVQPPKRALAEREESLLSESMRECPCDATSFLSWMHPCILHRALPPFACPLTLLDQW